MTETKRLLYAGLLWSGLAQAIRDSIEYPHGLVYMQCRHYLSRPIRVCVTHLAYLNTYLRHLHVCLALGMPL